MRIQLAVLDMAGTTVADDGLVIEAFTEALSELDVDRDQALGYVRRPRPPVPGSGPYRPAPAGRR
jgi:beta-phosphoglucomutase-like phosphatase (HAD superfamily)